MRSHDLVELNPMCIFPSRFSIANTLKRKISSSPLRSGFGRQYVAPETQGLRVEEQFAQVGLSES
jgi:hypothetical protein